MSDRQSFLESRRTCIGGSDWASILSLPGAYGTPLDVWRSKVEPIVDDEQTYQQARGDALEPFVCAWFARTTGKSVYRDISIPFPPPDSLPKWWRCQIDAVVDEGELTLPLEAKTATSFKRDEWGESGTDQVPMRYVVQVMAQIAYLGAPYSYLAVDIGGDQFRHYRIVRDEALIRFMRERGTAFWQLVESGTPPPPTSSSEANLVWRNHEPGEYLTADGQVAALCRAINEHKAEIKIREVLRDALELELKSMLEFREGAKDAQGNVLCTWKTQSSDRIDTKALRAEQPQIAAKYVKTTTTRVLRVKDTEG